MDKLKVLILLAALVTLASLRDNGYPLCVAETPLCFEINTLQFQPVGRQYVLAS